MSKEFPIAPFKPGQAVISISNFKRCRKIWPFNYPKKGDICVVDSIRKHPRYDFWLVTIPSCECELYHKKFIELPVIVIEQKVYVSVHETITQQIGENKNVIQN